MQVDDPHKNSRDNVKYMSFIKNDNSDVQQYMSLTNGPNDGMQYMNLSKGGSDGVQYMNMPKNVDDGVQYMNLANGANDGVQYMNLPNGTNSGVRSTSSNAMAPCNDDHNDEHQRKSDPLVCTCSYAMKTFVVRLAKTKAVLHFQRLRFLYHGVLGA